MDGGDVIRGYLRDAIINLGVGEGDIEAVAFIVMMQATQDMNSDLKEVMGKVKAYNSARQKLRGLRRKIAADSASGVSYIDKDLHDGTIKTARDLTSILESMDAQLDTLGEMQEEMSLRLQKDVGYGRQHHR